MDRSSSSFLTKEEAQVHEVQDSISNESTSSRHNAIESAKPPSLDYDLFKRRWSLTLNVALIVLFNFGVTSAVFYGVKNTTDLAPSALYGVVTAVCATSLPPWFVRLYSLSKNGGERSSVPDEIFSPNYSSKEHTIGQKFKHNVSRWDVFQSAFIIGAVVTTVLVALGTSLNGDEGEFKLVVLATPALFTTVGIELLSSCFLNKLNIKVPFRLSSRATGSVVEPALFYVWQDLTAVDGAGGYKFRQSFTNRYDSSPPFKDLIFKLTFLIGFGTLLSLPFACISTFLIDNTNIAWGAVQATLVVWISLVSLGCIWFALRGLKLERKWWMERASGI